MRDSLIFIVVAMINIMMADSVYAGGSVVPLGATEATQLLNHAELLESVAQQAQMVNNQITAQMTRIQQLLSMYQNLQSLNPTALAQMMTPYSGQLAQYQQLLTTVNALQSVTISVQSLLMCSYDEMTSLNMSPAQWLNALIKLVSERGNIYQQQLQRDLQSMQTFATRAQNLQNIASQVPGIAGNLQGLQLLNQQSSIAAGELMDIHALIQRQVMTQLQQQSDQSNAAHSAAALLKAQQAAATAINAQEKAAIEGGTFTPLVDH